MNRRQNSASSFRSILRIPRLERVDLPLLQNRQVAVGNCQDEARHGSPVQLPRLSGNAGRVGPPAIIVGILGVQLLRADERVTEPGVAFFPSLPADLIQRLS